MTSTTSATPVEALRDRWSAGAGAALVWSLVLISVLPWRTESYFAGGVDPVVIAKSGIAILAATVAWVGFGHAERVRDIGIRPLALVGLYLAISVLGGWSVGALGPSLVLAVRVSLLLATVVLLMLSYDALAVTRGLRDALTWVGLLVALTGLGGYLADGRLGGGLLPLSPNQLSMMFGFALMTRFWEVLAGIRTRWWLPMSGLLLLLVWVTGSRTGLAAAMLGLAVIALTHRRLPTWVLVVGAAMMPVALFVLTQTGVASSYFARGGGQSVLTLNSRTIAWKAAFEQPYDFWNFWFGRGMSTKTIGVAGTYWDEQVLDSSWVSAFVQAGALGLLVLIVLVMTTVWSALRMPAATRSLWFPVAIFVSLWSLTASGLLDAYVLFLLLLVTAIASDRPTYRADGSAPVGTAQDL